MNLSKSGRAVSYQMSNCSINMLYEKNSVYPDQLASTEDNFVFNIGRDHLVI